MRKTQCAGQSLICIQQLAALFPSSWKWLLEFSQEESAHRHHPVSVRVTNCCFRLTVRGNECLWWQWSTLANGNTIVWIAEVEAAQGFWGLTEHTEFCGGGRDAYAGLCFQKAVIMSFTPNVWLSCSSLTYFRHRSFLLPVVCGLSVPVDGGRIWWCGFLLRSWWQREARHMMIASPLVFFETVSLVAAVFTVQGAQCFSVMVLSSHERLLWIVAIFFIKKDS